MASDWASILSGVPQGSVPGPLRFLIFGNDLEEGIKSQIKFFADDTSLFSIIHAPDICVSDLNHDLDLMSFDPDPTKPAEEILFSVKPKSPYYSLLY